MHAPRQFGSESEMLEDLRTSEIYEPRRGSDVLRIYGPERGRDGSVDHLHDNCPWVLTRVSIGR
ncbi:MAG: hypothetical protein JO286_18835 [Solirubrobacterales bacterium]|nr:hypothetical protein [Solirubrobacterales bacterium]MBV9365299.1 hypothetical protein [Solirubrobacterales bacterium]MBV9809247.1 hypothetical protein [Solirubrobacterales bacterium]